MELVKVQLNEAMAGVTESYSVGEVIEFPRDKANRLIAQGTANLFVESGEVVELKAEVARLKAENKRLSKKKK
jgi:hypothetical protein|tara:strand:- start:3943 stop:4161 length:219 start_codon:yes stop_codon:yes gene_type:complete